MNIWHWESTETFREYVHPIEHAPGNAVHVARSYTGFERVVKFCRVVCELESACSELERIISIAAHPPTSPFSEDQFDEVWTAAHHIVSSGEYALAYCKPLAKTKGGEEFIERKHIFEQLPRYQAQSWGSCKSWTVDFLQTTKQFLEAIHDFLETEKTFLDHVPDLPEDLKIDFVAARDVMSLGYDEAGLIYAGRGLEGVVRRIAQDHKVIPGKAVERLRLAEILTTLEAKRFSHNQSLVIDEQTKQLLQLSRVMRNHSAHPNSQRGSQGFREGAILMAQKANELWKKCSASGVQFV
jgi:hypothetical protein